jgi:hypothetical protein
MKIKQPKLEPRKVDGDVKWETKTIEANWIVDPIQDTEFQEQMSKNPAFAEAIMRPRTELLLRMIQEKVRYREHIGIEIKGGTRTGKSTAGIVFARLISSLTGVPFTLKHICPNEIIYLQRLKDPNLPNGSVFLIDEQTEAHTGAGSYAEMAVLEDIQQICAKEQIHTIWCHPHEFVGRMSSVGIETYGKDPTNLLIRGIMYNIGISRLTKQPMGQVIIPVGHLFNCGIYGKPTKTKTGLDTITTCIKGVCPKYGKCQEFMAQYEYEKDGKIKEVRTRQLKDRELERLGIIEAVAADESFQQAINNTERMSIARFLVPFGTPEKLIGEFVVMAKAVNDGRIDLNAIKKKALEASGQKMPEEN